jgi:hypothetical protein
MSKPILCLDFDGVIHSYTSGWKGAGEIPDPPVAGALAAILGYIEAGFQVAIFSSRSKSWSGRLAMRRWLRRHFREHFWTIGLEHPEAPWTGLDTDELHDQHAHRIVAREIKWPWFKPPALITIDDRALTFDGTWPTAETIRAFRPWNKKPPPRVPHDR